MTVSPTQGVSTENMPPPAPQKNEHESSQPQKQDNAEQLVVPRSAKKSAAASERKKRKLRQEELLRKQPKINGFFTRAATTQSSMTPVPKAHSATLNDQSQPDIDEYFRPFVARSSVVMARSNARQCPDIDISSQQQQQSPSQKSLSLQYGLMADCVRVGTDGTMRVLLTAGKAFGQVPAELLPQLASNGERVTVKLLQFHDNHRPAYYGTVANSSILTRRHARRFNTQLLTGVDYDYDSDDEWAQIDGDDEGEDLASSGDDADDVEMNDNGIGDDDDGWLVPAGYLSEDEGDHDAVENGTGAKQPTIVLKKAMVPVVIGPIWQVNAAVATLAQFVNLQCIKLRRPLPPQLPVTPAVQQLAAVTLESSQPKLVSEVPVTATDSTHQPAASVDKKQPQLKTFPVTMDGQLTAFLSACTEHAIDKVVNACQSHFTHLHQLSFSKVCLSTKIRAQYHKVKRDGKQVWVPLQQEQ